MNTFFQQLQACQTLENDYIQKRQTVALENLRRIQLWQAKMGADQLQQELCKTSLGKQILKLLQTSN